MTAAICTRCGLDLDPDAPGSRCRCAPEEPARSTVTASRGRAGSSGASLHLAAVGQLAAALANSDGRPLSARDMDLARSILDSKVQA